MKLTHQLSSFVLFLAVLALLNSCNKENDKETGTIEFIGVSAGNSISMAQSKSLLDPETSTQTHTMHTLDLHVNISEIWVSQEQVIAGETDNYTWYRIGEGQNELKSLGAYHFVSDHLPVGTYKSVKIAFVNQVNRIAVYYNNQQKEVEMKASLKENKCGNSEIVYNYFSMKGSMESQGSGTKLSMMDSGETVRGFKVKANEVSKLYFKMGWDNYQLTDCAFSWDDQNNNGSFECDVDFVYDFDCIEKGPMWSLSVDDGEEDPFIYNAVTDIDGNTYHAVRIGEQTWMQSNLKTSKLNDGTYLMTEEERNAWCEENAPCVPPSEALPVLRSSPNKQPEMEEGYGMMYNWGAIATGKVCPQGWHVPSREEWQELIDFLGENAGGKLKSTDAEASYPYSWQAPNTGATNEYLFSALPAGGYDGADSRYIHDTYGGGYGTNAMFFSNENQSQIATAPQVTFILLTNSSADIQFGQVSWDSFLSCRCVKDE